MNFPTPVHTIYLTWIPGLDAIPDGCLPGLQKLPESRKQKVLRLKSGMEQRRSLAAGLLLDYAMKAHGLPDYAQRLHTGPHGKPLLDPDIGLYISLSHSGHWAALAVAYCPVGIDVEHDRRPLPVRIFPRVFTPEEQRRLQSSPDSPTFLRLWTGKEAVLKLLGDGFSRSAAGFSLLPFRNEVHPLQGTSCYLFWKTLPGDPAYSLYGLTEALAPAEAGESPADAPLTKWIVHPPEIREIPFPTLTETD